MDDPRAKKWFWPVLQWLAAILFVWFYFYQEQLIHAAIGTPTKPHLGFRIWLPLTILSISFLLFHRLRWISVALLGTFATLIYIGDLIYYSYFETMPTLLSGIPLSQAFTVRDSAFQLMGFGAFAALAVMLGYWFFAITTFRSKQFQVKSMQAIIIGKATGGLLGLTAFFLLQQALVTPIIEKTHHIGRNPVILPKDHWAAEYSNVSVCQVYGVPYYHVKDFHKFFSNRKDLPPLDPAEEVKIDLVLNEIKKRNDSPSPLKGIAAGYNVIFVQLEAFQVFLINKTYEGVEITPFLNRLYRDTLHWNSIFDGTYLGRTSDAEFIVNTGMMVDIQGAAAMNHTKKDLFAFPRALKEKGYQTLSFHGYRKDFWNRTNAHPFYGIDRLHFQEDYDIKEKLGLGFPDHIFFPVIADQLAAVSQPFFAFVISLSCHHPFNDTPENYQSLFPEISQIPKMSSFSNYFKLARYTDDVLAAFYQSLEEKGLLDRTILAFYGDHDLGGFDMRQSIEVTRQYRMLTQKHLGLFPFDLPYDRVPLAISIPSKQEEIRAIKDQYSDVPGTLSDLFPTIFHLLGLETPKGVFGSHLFQTAPRVVPLPHGVDPANHIIFQRAISAEGLLLASSSGHTKLTIPMTDGFPRENGIPEGASQAATDALRANQIILVYDIQKKFLEPK